MHTVVRLSTGISRETDWLKYYGTRVDNFENNFGLLL